MRRLQPRQRSTLRPGRYQYTAGMGLRYHVPLTPALDQFFGQLSVAWRNIVGLEELTPKRSEVVHRDRFRLHDTPQFTDPERALGLTVAELRLSGGEARRYGIKWATSNAGETRTRILDKLARLRSELALPAGGLSMRLVHAVPVGQHRGKAGDRKFALVPQARDRVANFLTEAHGLVLNELGGRIPLDTQDAGDRTEGQAWIPHLTVGHVFKAVPRDGVTACAAALERLVRTTPLTIRLTEESIYDQHIQRQPAAAV